MVNPHFKKRLHERHDFNINKKEYYQLTRQCRNIINRGLGKRLSNTRSLVVVDYRGKNLYVIFNKPKNLIITVLPEKEHIYTNAVT